MTLKKLRNCSYFLSLSTPHPSAFSTKKLSFKSSSAQENAFTFSVPKATAREKGKINFLVIIIVLFSSRTMALKTQTKNEKANKLNTANKVEIRA
jgi:pyridoxine/pyridoxamine 5'-phosphate oxidase